MSKKEGLKKWAINRFLKSFRNSDEEPINDRLQADKRLDNLCALAIIRAGLAGALSGMLISLVAYVLEPWEKIGNSEKLMVGIIIGVFGIVATSIAVSYTHLTLPRICSV